VHRHLACILAMLVAPAAAAQEPENLPEPFRAILAERAAQCAELQDGTLTLEEGAVRQVDLSGDGAPDWVLDEARLSCSSAASLYCGTGGCTVHFLVGDTLASQYSKGWEAVDFGAFRTLLLQVHGTRCGGIGAHACVQALTWDGEAGRFMTVAAEPDN